MKASNDSSCRVHFPCVLLIWMCVQVLLPEGHGSDWCPFSTAKINEVKEMAGEVRGLWDRTGDLCLLLPTMPPFFSAGFTTPSVEEWPGKEFKDVHEPHCPTAQWGGASKTALGQFSHFPQNSSAGWHILAIPQMHWVSLRVLTHKWAKSSKTCCIHLQKKKVW